MQPLDVAILILALIALPVCIISVVQVRRLKAKFISEHVHESRVLREKVGVIKSLDHAREKAPFIAELMEQYGARMLELPLASGGRVSFSGSAEPNLVP